MGEFDDKFQQGADYVELGVPGKTWLQEYGLLIFGGGGGLVAAGLTIWFGRDFSGNIDSSALAIASAFVLASLVLGYIGVRNAIAESKLGDVDVTWEPANLAFGDEFTGFIRFKPESSGRVNGVEIGTVAYHYVERSDSRGRTRKTRHNVYEDEATAFGSDGIDFDADEMLEFSASLDLPAHLEGRPASYYSWEMTVHIDIAAFPDWLETFQMYDGATSRP